MRLIDADALKEHLKGYTVHSVIQASLDRYASQAIDAETTVDAVPVVRCRECRYYNTMGRYRGEPKWCSILERMVKEEDYCSFNAERKENAES